MNNSSHTLQIFYVHVYCIKMRRTQETLPNDISAKHLDTLANIVADRMKLARHTQIQLEHFLASFPQVSC